MTCAIAGIGRTAFSSRSGRTTRAMAVSACREAIDDAGLTTADIDGLSTFMVYDSELPINVGYALGVDNLTWVNAMVGGGNLAADQIATAAAVIEAGLASAVLVYRSLNGRSGHRFGTVDGPLQVPDNEQFDTQSGYLVPPNWFAMWARRHQHEFGTTAEDLGAISIQQRAHAARNEHAVRRDLLTMDDYLGSRWINEPFRVLDCTSEVDGAVAVLVVSEEIARNTKQTPIWLVDSVHSQSGAGWSQWGDMTKMYAATTGPELWKKTGLSPADIDVALMYDCFTYTVLAQMEGFGFAERGGVGDFYREGRATYGGEVVVNPHGGLLSEGYIHGFNHHYEAALQLRHAAGERQVDDAGLALVTAGGGPHGGAIVYSREHP
jgi:acetyl-CoA acetyltransferase